MRVFISYAHTDVDTELAQFIAHRLGAAGVDVWMDERSMHGGQRVQPTIEAAAAGCGHAIFLVSRSWLASDWTNWELGLFDGRMPPATLVPIWRRDREELKLPPLLWQLAGFEWLEAERDLDARVWQLHCALMERPPGPVETWSAQGRALGAPAPGARAPIARPAAPRRPATLGVRPSLRCDRAPQWKTVDDLSTSGGSELMLVPGATGQAHEHFSERIQHLFRPDPPREIRWVDWGGRRDEPGRPRRRRPVSEDQYRDALAEALDVEAADLEAGLGALLAHRNLVLLHDCIHSRFLDDTLIAYYTRWLPEWLAASGAEMNLKCVQPVEWPREGAAARLLRWVGGGAGDGNSRPDADRLVGSVLDQAGPILRAVRLQELHDVSRPELDEFCQVMALRPRQIAWLLERIGSRRTRTASDVFDAIDDFIPEVPDERSMS